MNVSNLPDSLQSIRIDILTCQCCGAFREATKPVPFYGNCKSPIMFIARNPGEHEDRSGQPLFPKDRKLGEQINAGIVFRKILWHLHLTREDVYITNTMKCWTTVPKTNRAPTEQECKICSNNYLFKEIDIVDPQLIVTMGKEAFAIVYGTSFLGCHITQWAGRLITDHKYPIFPLLHPASIIHDPKYGIEYKKHVEELKNIWFNNIEFIRNRSWRKQVCDNNIV